MSSHHTERSRVDAKASAEHLRIVPAVPHVDRPSDTAPPWTVPTTPAYDLDPHADVGPSTTPPPAA